MGHERRPTGHGGDGVDAELEVRPNSALFRRKQPKRNFECRGRHGQRPVDVTVASEMGHTRTTIVRLIVDAPASKEMKRSSGNRVASRVASWPPPPPAGGSLGQAVPSAKQKQERVAPAAGPW